MSDEWVPKTELGRLVASGQIKTMSEALKTKLPLKEYEIVDFLIPNIKDEVINIKRAQRMTDSGRRMTYSITVVVGNEDGYVGIGIGRSKEASPAIRKALIQAKLKIIEIKRGCGSWECGCGRAHTLPYLVTGKSGSVEITLKPAPRGVGLAVGNVAKTILRMGGIEDAWGFAAGHTKTTVNYALAVYNALRETSKVRINPSIILSTPIYSGSVINASNNSY